MIMKRAEKAMKKIKINARTRSKEPSWHKKIPRKKINAIYGPVMLLCL
jgi:hypothetical protein